MCPSVSPENTYILPDGNGGRVCFNSTMDIMILRELLQNFISASEVLQKTTLGAEEILEKLPEIKIGQYALHPGNEITVDGTPELAQAAKVTLERRLAHGGGYTGWSCGKIITCCIHAFSDWKGEVVYNGTTRTVTLKAGESCRL